MVLIIPWWDDRGTTLRETYFLSKVAKIRTRKHCIPYGIFIPLSLISVSEEFVKKTADEDIAGVKYSIYIRVIF